jgi:hypothetical protein
MTPRYSNRHLWIASAAMLGLSVAAIALAMTMPIDDLAATRLSPGVPGAIVREPQHISREQLERDASRQLQQPLLDSPAPATDAPVVAPAVPLPPLIGTIVEPGRSVALVQIPDATISFKHVGDTIADARIVAIDMTSMTVVRQGQTVSVRMSRPEPVKTIASASVPILGTGVMRPILSSTRQENGP